MGSSGEEEVTCRFNDIEFSDRVLRLEIMPSNRTEDSNTPEDGVTDPKLKKIHIDSLILAYNSQFFYKLFNNGMKETQQRDEVGLKINESEEASFMDLLKFIYDHSVNASSATDLVDVLMAADKFEVPSCVKYCVEALHKLPMSTELAVYFLGLPSTVLADEVVQTLTASAESFIDAHYRDFTKRSQEEAMGLSLGALEIVLGRDDLQVDSEDTLFDFVLKWGRLLYPDSEERREILTRLVLKFMCLPKMSSLKLKEMTDCSDLDSGKLWKPVVDALYSKDHDATTTKYDYPKRSYNLIAVKVVHLQYADPQCVVYFDLTKKECADLVPGKRLYSQTFFSGGNKFSLFVTCTEEPRNIFLYLHKMEGSGSLRYAFSVMTKDSNNYTSVWDYPYASSQEIYESGHLFKTSCKEFMSADSEFFIDGVLHLRANITLVS